MRCRCDVGIVDVESCLDCNRLEPLHEPKVPGKLDATLRRVQIPMKWGGEATVGIKSFSTSGSIDSPTEVSTLRIPSQIS